MTDFRSEASSYTHLPAVFTLRVENMGSVHQKPVGQIFIKNFLGRQVASVQVNADSRNVLPNSARVFRAVWQKETVADTTSEFAKEWSNFALGPYTATVVLNYGSRGQTVTANASFWVLPWMVFFLYLVLLSLLVALLWIGLKRYNAWVVDQYKRQDKRESKK